MGKGTGRKSTEGLGDTGRGQVTELLGLGWGQSGECGGDVGDGMFGTLTVLCSSVFPLPDLESWKQPCAVMLTGGGWGERGAQGGLLEPRVGLKAALSNLFRLFLGLVHQPERTLSQLNKETSQGCGQARGGASRAPGRAGTQSPTPRQATLRSG